MAMYAFGLGGDRDSAGINQFTSRDQVLALTL